MPSSEQPVGSMQRQDILLVGASYQNGENPANTDFNQVPSALSDFSGSIHHSWFSGRPRPVVLVNHTGAGTYAGPSEHNIPGSPPFQTAFSQHTTRVSNQRTIDWPWHPPSSTQSSLFIDDRSRTQEEIQQLLQHVRPDEDLDAAGAGLQPPGLRVQLLPHQAKGLAWMKNMEEGSNKGGILADDMGLGKTVQAISLMLEHPPPADEHKPTLVITPVALLEQWKSEFQKFLRISHLPSLITLHGQDARRPWSEVAEYDIVLTTYGTLASESRRWLTSLERLQFDPEARQILKDEFPTLGEGSTFHRIVLDEAHLIKNKNTKTAKAVCMLSAKYRWCLTGTPMQNRVEEIYSLIKFCRMRPYDDAEQFGRDIVRPLRGRNHQSGTLAMEKFQALLRAILLRRTKTSTINGTPILQLPPKHEVEDRVVFDKDQLEFYQALEREAQIQFNRYITNGKVGRNYSKTLVLLLRLRQCCCSPQLITNLRDFVTCKIFRGIDMLANAQKMPHAVVQRIQEDDEIECPVCMDAVDNPTIFNPCGHTVCTDCFCQMADCIEVEVGDRLTCPHCRGSVELKKITDLESLEQVWSSEQIQASSINQAHLHRGTRQNNATKERVLSRLEKIYQPCAKIDRLVQLLHEIRHRGEGEKTIVFSSFTSFLDLVECCMRQDTVLMNYARYDGSMSVQERSKAVARFMLDLDCQFMLISLKAGNTGLNLSVANHVVILDPFWNPFLELQAMDRCHRIGQLREVTVHRMLIGGQDEEQPDLFGDPVTIEDRIMQLQATKKQLFESASRRFAFEIV
ncbi:hypothetical protein LTR05_008745 [Lithohypha guttulata]|uniref:Uncharacterized protein n=1 Tax=Lithohypha guttulata TaxID=1690604 RepID=A0AAN7PS10_9EURO|nr:hypothetical protein LTR05_008745 [Lithohypha guttulata]